MATFRLRYFSRPDTLRSIAPSRLLELLAPYREVLAAAGCVLPTVAREELVPYQRLGELLAAASEALPAELLNVLYLIDEMATPEGADALLEAAFEENLSLDADQEQTPADVAVQVWLRRPELLERKHAERMTLRPRTFEYYQTAWESPPVFRGLSASAKERLEHDLDDWLERRRRGRGSRVFVFPDEHEVRFLVRRGEPFRREESLSEKGVCGICYRPVRYDVVIFDRRLGELRINARLAGEKRLYARLFGKHLFADEGCFPGGSKYTLEPLRHVGAEGLTCFDIEGLQWIRLVEVEVLFGGAYHARECRKADDVPADLAQRGRTLPQSGRLLKAVFRVKFADGRTPRSVTIRPSNVAQYTRDADAAMVERWLQSRGYIVAEEAAEHETFSEVLASA